MIYRLRLYHATLAVLAILAYLSEDLDALHALLGYGVGAVILFRLGWAASGNRTVGLARFHPQFKGLRVYNALSHPAVSRTLMLTLALLLIGVTATGIAIDRGRTLGLAASTVVSTAYADDDERHERSPSLGAEQRSEHGDDDLLTELHEALGESLPLLVALHAGYLLLFKLPLARFMLYLDDPATRRRRGTAAATGDAMHALHPDARSTSSPPR